MKPIYLDYHATTPVDPRVLEAMLPYFTETFGNAASRQHAYGWAAQEAVESARAQVAELIGARPAEIYFTSGASESNNLAIKGMVEGPVAPSHVITVATEHKSVLDSCRRLEERGCTVTRLSVDRDGFIDLQALRDAITDRTVLISVMAANNEIGVLQPLREIGAIARERGVAFHSDAAQAAGKIPIDVGEMGLDLVALTAHKCYGPKGAGAVYIRKRRPRISLTTQIDGGGQEQGVRSGTLNVPGIVGLGKAAEICRLEMAAEASRLKALRDTLLERLRAQLDGVRVNGHLGDRRLPHNLHVSFDGVEGEALLMALGDIAVSTGSACSSGTQAPSHVLEAIGAVGDRAGASIRFGLGRNTTADEVEFAASHVAHVVQGLRVKTSV
jgi:cysteine desulfurase